MNAVEIEEAVSRLVEQTFEAAQFPYQFLEAFGNKPNTIKRLQASGKSTTNKTDITGEGITAVLQRNNIHIATCDHGGPDAVAELLDRLTRSDATAKHKVKFALATDGQSVHAASLNSDEPPLVCNYAELADHFGYFLELAGISTVRQIRENAFDIKATGRLNRLYIELLRNNPDWGGDRRREDLNQFFARLIFCFFAEDTGIFNGNDLFTQTLRQMSEPSGANTDFVLAEIFRAMDVPMQKRDAANLRSWAKQFPYVNGGLFGGCNEPGLQTSGSPRSAVGKVAGGERLTEASPAENAAGVRSQVPKFNQIARSYLLHIGSLDWTRINPDIFGSMIQAVADDEERGALGMHYTSVPNILKVLNPLFLDDLREKLEEAGDNPRKLLNLRKRLARIRVFDPACGSGNFLVIAYKQMREIEAEINRRRGEPDRASDIPLTNFRGIEIRHFAAEIARLALIIAEYQCDVLYRGERLALAEFLPLDSENWITHGNALRLDWLKVCPPSGTGVKLTEDDLFQTPLDQIEIDFENEGGETYICGNPPYLGSKWQTDAHKADLAHAIGKLIGQWRVLDYVAGWFVKAIEYGANVKTKIAFVATNSIVQGQQVPVLWPTIINSGHVIAFAKTSFQWSNLASNKAGVTVVIICLTKQPNAPRLLETSDTDGAAIVKQVQNINPYLIPGQNIVVVPTNKMLSGLPEMTRGNSPTDGGNLLLERANISSLALSESELDLFIKPFVGAKELVANRPRYCIWIEDQQIPQATAIQSIRERIDRVSAFRLASKKLATKRAAAWSHRFDERKPLSQTPILCIPVISSENREYLPADVLPPRTVVSNKAFMIPGWELYLLSIIVSRLNTAWVATVCARMRTDFSYTNTLGWNTFPVPPLTDQNKADLTRCAEEILLAREAHWPATIAELYDPEKMPADLRAAHDRNDETLERIYIGRRFKNDTERLETLFQMYTEMTAKEKEAR